MNCDNILKPKAMCLIFDSRILICEGKFWYMFDDSTDIIAFSSQSQLILQRIPNNICYCMEKMSHKHCFAFFIFPTLYNAI